MLSIDLFDSKYERRLHEGAVDSTIEHLLKPLSLRAADIRTKLRSGGLDPKQIDKLEKEYEDLVQQRLDIILNREKTTEQQVPVQTPTKGQDLITPQQRVAGATPPPTSMLGKAKETFASFANWLAGRDDTGPTYESALNETDPNSAINAAKYAYEQMRKAHDGNVDIATIRWMSGGEPITMSRNQIYHTLTKLAAMSRQNRNAFALQTLADRNNFSLWLGSQKKVAQRPQLKQPTDPFQPELPLGKPKIGPVQERVQKKKSNDIQAGDVKVAREIQKLRAQYPAARSDIEAVARAEIDSTERSQQQLAAIRGANEKQDALLKQLVALDREQGQEINSLDSENNNLEKQLARVQATNDRLLQTVGQMTGTKKSSRTAPGTVASTSAEVDPATVKKVQDLETQIQQLQAKPQTPQNQDAIKNLNTRLASLTAAVGQLTPGKTTKPAATDKFGDLDATMQKIQKEPVTKKSGPQLKTAISNLDVSPANRASAKKTKTSKSKIDNTDPSEPDNDVDILGLEDPNIFAIKEHGGGIGPQQHWQSLMRNEGQSDKNLELAANEFIKGIYDPTGPVYRAAYKSFPKGQAEEAQLRKHIAKKYGVSEKELSDAETNYRASRLAGSRRRIKSEDQIIDEGIKDTTAATAVIACLLTGGSLSGCATAPQQTTAQQVLKTGQDIGRTVQSAKKITRASAEAEVQQEIRNILRGINRPEELNNSNILRIWKRIKGQPPVTPEPQAPEYGPAEPMRRPATEAKEINTKDDFIRERDRLLRMINMETDPANKQILKSAIRQLEGRAENEGWIAMQQRMIREDTAALAAEDAILKRIFVKHRDLMMEYGPDKITQAAESVAYNVGDIAHITDDQIQEWVGQVEYILGARP
jgi:hypothetical protein